MSWFPSSFSYTVQCSTFEWNDRPEILVLDAGVVERSVIESHCKFSQVRSYVYIDSSAKKQTKKWRVCKQNIVRFKGDFQSAIVAHFPLIWTRDIFCVYIHALIQCQIRRWILKGGKNGKERIKRRNNQIHPSFLAIMFQ